MSDPFSWSVNLGRWSGTTVRIHLLLILFAVGRLFDALFLTKNQSPQSQPVLETAAWLLLLLGALVLHELGHAAIASRVGADYDEIRLWPLGNLSGPGAGIGSRASENILVALAGPLTSLGVAIVTALGLNLAHTQLVINPFGNSVLVGKELVNFGGAPLIGKDEVAAAFTSVWWIGWFGYLNWLLFVANLIPALPMDMGRVARSALSGPTFGPPRDGVAAPLLARACVLLLIAGGLARLVMNRTGVLTLLSLALLIELMVRVEARMMEDGGYFDDGVFGYDFSEGYTSLESSVQKVRPRRESALKRWRRRRSDLRRQRRQAQELAEDRRMDEILAKLHNQGRSALSDDEQRFLLRVSTKIKNRTKPG